MAKTQQVHVVFSERCDLIGPFWGNEPKKRVVYGVWIDLAELRELARDATKNKSRKAKHGALHIEIHSVEEMPVPL